MPINYLICALPRTGSWLLADALHRSGRAGRPEEYFRPDYMAGYLADWGGPPSLNGAAYVRRVVQETAIGGVFGAKVHWPHFAGLLKALNTTGRETGAVSCGALGKVLPGVRYVLLTRIDTAGQACSYYRAMATDVWWELGAPSADESAFPDRPSPEDLARVGRLERLLIAHEASWRRYFHSIGVRPLALTYEDLVGDYTGSVGGVLEYLGAPAPPEPIAPRLRRQADAVTDTWSRCYRRYRAASVNGGRR